MRCVMELSASYRVKCLMVNGVEVLVSQIEGVFLTVTGYLNLRFNSIQIDVFCDDAFYGVFLTNRIFLLFYTSLLCGRR